MSERERFETVYAGHMPQQDERGGYYPNYWLEAAWAGWQARAADSDKTPLPPEFEAAFVTAVSDGSEKRYEVVFKFRDIHAMQAAHTAWVLRKNSIPADARDGVKMSQCGQCGEFYTQYPEPHTSCPTCCRRDSDRLDSIASESLKIEPYGGGWRVLTETGQIAGQVRHDDLREAIDQATTGDRSNCAER